MTQEDQSIKYVGTLELRDGTIHFVNDEEMHPHYGGYHSATSTIFYGGKLEMTDPLTLKIGQRYIHIQSGDKVELVSKFAENCDAWHTIDDSPEVRSDIERMVGTPRIMNPETRDMIGTAAGAQLQAQAQQQGQQRAPGIGVRLRLAPGVGLRSMPKSGWTLQSDGNITDEDGVLLYIKANVQAAQYAPSKPGREGAGAATGSAAQRPAAAASTPEPQGTGLMGSLRRLFGGR